MSDVGNNHIRSAVPNLIKLVTPVAKEILTSLGMARDFEILKRRFGLEGSDIYTLQDLGIYYGVTRERVRQIEGRAIRTIKRIFLDCPEGEPTLASEDVVQEAQRLRGLLAGQDKVLTEEEIVRLVENRYASSFTHSEIGAIRLMLTIFGFQSIENRVVGTHLELLPAWVSADSLHLPTLREAAVSMYRVLLAAVTPLPAFDLIIRMNRRRKSKIEPSYVQYAAKICPAIQEAEKGIYQVRLEYLQSLADKAYRVLYEAQEELHLREICRKINSQLATVESSSARPRSLQGQLVGDPRFRSVGRGGVWGLSKWNLRTLTIVDLMQEYFHRHQSKATVDDVFSYVSSQRKRVSKKSVYIYLMERGGPFIRVSESEFELAAWGGRSYRQNKRPTTKASLELETERIFAERKNTSLPLSDLVHLLVNRTGIAERIVRRVLKNLPMLEIQPHPVDRRRKMVESHT